MTPQEQLYAKVAAEYAAFIDGLKGRTPEEIINAAYEKVCKEEAVIAVERGDYSAAACAAMSEYDDLLDVIYMEWLSTDSADLDEIQTVITDLAEKEAGHTPAEIIGFPTGAETPTALAVNGDVRPGDWVIATPRDEYGYLIGTVTGIDKLGTPEHDTENETDDVHVDFTAFDYPQERIAEIEAHFSDLYGEPKSFGALPLDDVIMAPDALIRVTHLSRDEIARMGGLLANCQAFCNCFAKPERAEGKHSELMERLEQNHDSYFNSLLGFGKRELTEMAEKITAMSAAFRYLNYHGFEEDELNFLLQFQNPLEVVADGRLDYQRDADDEMGFAFDNVMRHKQDWLETYPLAVNPLKRDVPAIPKEAAQESVKPDKAPAPKQKQSLTVRLKDADAEAKAYNAQKAQDPKNKTKNKEELT